MSNVYLTVKTFAYFIGNFDGGNGIWYGVLFVLGKPQWFGCCAIGGGKVGDEG